MYVSICMYTYIYRVLGKCKSRLVECKSRLARFAGENRVWGLCIASGRGDRVMGVRRGSDISFWSCYVLFLRKSRGLGVGKRITYKHQVRILAGLLAGGGCWAQL